MLKETVQPNWHRPAMNYISMEPQGKALHCHRKLEGGQLVLNTSTFIKFCMLLPSWPDHDMETFNDGAFDLQDINIEDKYKSNVT